MEDAATAEISRSQIWQWINAGRGVRATASVKATAELVREVAADELAAIRAEIGEEAFAAGKWQQAHDLLLQVALDEELRRLPDPARPTSTAGLSRGQPASPAIRARRRASVAGGAGDGVLVDRGQAAVLDDRPAVDQRAA